MKHLYIYHRYLLSSVLLCAAIFITSCATLEIREFDGAKLNAEGSLYRLFWNVAHSDSIAIPGVALGLPPVGSIEARQSETTTYVLQAYSGGDVSERRYTAQYTKRVKDIEPPENASVQTYRPRDVSIELSSSQSNYLRGRTTIEDVKAAGSRIRYEILAVDRSGYPDSVKILLLAKDEYGNFVAGLAPPYIEASANYKDYFRSLTDSVAQTIEQEVAEFSVREYHDEAAPPLSVAIVLDKSLSMQFSINALLEAANELAQRKRGKDELTVINFSNGVALEAPLSEDVRRVQHDSRLGFATALYDGAHRGIRELDSAKYRKALILFTDGWDNWSRHTVNDVVRYARESDVRIYAIGHSIANMPVLTELAMLTDGKAYYAINGQEINQVYEEMWRSFRNYYVVTYKPPEGNGLHSLALTCAQGAGGEADTIHGAYFIGAGADVKSETTIILALFDFDKCVVQSEYFPRIRKFGENLSDKDNATVLIKGHTDQVDTDAYNDKLSMRRARSVKRILLKTGLLPHQLRCAAYGETQPRHLREPTPNHAQENRRVEAEVDFERASVRDCSFSVALCSVHDEATAREIQAALLNRRIADDVYIVQENDDNGRNVYRVRAGCFTERGAAVTESRRLRTRCRTLLRRAWSVGVDGEAVQY